MQSSPAAEAGRWRRDLSAVVDDETCGRLGSLHPFSRLSKQQLSVLRDVKRYDRSMRTFRDGQKRYKGDRFPVYTSNIVVYVANRQVQG